MSASIDHERDGLTLSHQFTPTMHRQVYPAISPKTPSNSAAGKSVLVTGATRGIGRAIALSWAQAGAAKIVVTGRKEHLLTEVSKEIKSISPSTKVVAIRSEAASEEATKELWSRVKQEVGIIDVLIANAGVFSEGNGFPVTGKIDPSLWWSDMEINVRGTYLQIYNFLQQHLVDGKEPKGTIIIVTAAAASMTLPGISSYSTSKLVTLRLVDFLNLEHPEVRSFGIHPGLVLTDMQVDVFKKMAVDPPELTGALSLYLSTSRADFLRGSYVAVNWDVEEMEQHAAEIKEKKLLNTAFLNAKLGPEGHPFEGSS